MRAARVVILLLALIFLAVPAHAAAELRLFASSSRPSARAGDPITFTLSVFGDGPYTIALAQADPAIRILATVATSDTIAPGAPATVTIAAQVDPAAGDAYRPVTLRWTAQDAAGQRDQADVTIWIGVYRAPPAGHLRWLPIARR